MAQEPMEKLNRAEALILQGEQQLKQAALDFWDAVCSEPSPGY